MPLPLVDTFSIDWSCDGVGTVNTAQRNRVAKHFMQQGTQAGVYVTPDPVTAEFPAVDEWALLVDSLSRPEVPDGTQGMGVMAWCDQTLGCPTGLSCQHGWCLGPNESWPVWTVGLDGGGTTGQSSDPGMRCAFQEYAIYRIHQASRASVGRGGGRGWY